MKVDLSSATDSHEASALGHENDYIMIYSNSWGPSDLGFVVDGPDSYTITTFKNSVASVCFNYFDSYELHVYTNYIRVNNYFWTWPSL